ncbi:hypothetical protein Glove_144g56 [Diversispora epigaea]|uniref:Uncharacterized protein n=1 Tax=Diversispora epigaea TaxID=1348612 RepID=A0A397J2J8_9GLOM|nr:hypothetical protein Glove_144g56 [Diversispora epigaea]
MPGFDITTFLDKKDRTLPKPFNIRPGYDLKYVTSYIGHYFAFDGKRYDELFDNERLFDNLSTIKHNETPVQWGIRVRIPLQNLLNAGKFSVYHRYCLFMSFGQGKFVNFDYRRLRIHKSHMAICFDCWKLVKIDDVTPKKSFHFTRERIIQRAYRRFQERVPSNARLAWLSLPNDNTTDDEKFLGLTPHKVKNSTSIDRIKMCLNNEYAEYIKKYNRYPFVAEYEIEIYKEYIIPYDWIGSKKRQLRYRFQKRLLELEA